MGKGEQIMPKLLRARQPEDTEEERKIRKLANSRHAPGDLIFRARIIALSWQGVRTTRIAEELGCHPKTVRTRLHRFNSLGIDGLGDRPGAGRKPRLTELWNARGSSLCPERSHPDAWCAAVVESSKPSMRRERRTGRWMPSPLPHNSGV
jgi:DNA-binding CsgD family transcriptional regulator